MSEDEILPAPEPSSDCPRELEAGDILDRRFKVLVLLGEGASGKVYKCQDSILQRVVAVKILHQSLLKDAIAIERFRLEALTGNNLLHPGICRVYAQGLDGQGRLYMVMDYLEGRTLAELLAAEGKLSLAGFFTITMQIVDALKYAHSQSVVHRDVKPANVMLIADAGGEKAVLMDFGLAKILSEFAGASQTLTNSPLGSSAYMSPEQIRVGPVDGRSDIYSLGCVMLECLAGSAPFQGASNFDVMYKHLHQSLAEIGFLKEIPPRLSGILRRCLQKDPEQRYQSLVELEKDLKDCLEMQDTLNRRWSLSSSDSGVSKPLLVVLLFLGFSGLCVFLLFRPSHSPVADEFYRAEHSKSKKKLRLQDQYLNGSKINIERIIKQLEEDGQADEVPRLLLYWDSRFGEKQSVDEEAKEFVWRKLFRIYRSRSDFRRSFEYLNRISSLNPNIAVKVATALDRSEIFKLEGRYPDSIACLDQILKDEKSELETFSAQVGFSALLEAKGDCYSDMGLRTEALKFYKEALDASNQANGGRPYFEKNPLRLKIVCELAKQERPKSEIENVLKQCLEAGRIKKEPVAASQVYLTIARAFRFRGFPDEFVYYMRKAIQDAGSLDEKFAEENELLDFLFLQGRANELSAYLKSIVDRSRSLGGRDQVLGLSLVANIYLRLKENKESALLSREAIAVLLLELKKNPGLILGEKAALSLGAVDVLVRNEDVSSAEKEAVLTEFFRFYTASCSEGHLRLMDMRITTSQLAGNFSAALKLADQFVKEAEDCGEALPTDLYAGTLFRRAAVLESSGKTEQAMADYKAILKLAERDGLAPYRARLSFLRMAMGCRRLNKPENAAEFLDQFSSSFGSRYRLGPPLSEEELSGVKIGIKFMLDTGHSESAIQVARAGVREVDGHYGEESPQSRELRYYLLLALIAGNKKGEASSLINEMLAESKRKNLKDQISQSLLNLKKSSFQN
ncbi:MAG: serine/threonine protein kinase [Candidatus Obscuribacterales bacterium]|nr:serine/threonine protein kinase [Candidatus Obscuribacterales bacterium]